MAEDWIAAHGNDLIQVKLIDLLSAVARMDQVWREQSADIWETVHQRIFTCDLPRLRGYLPPEAQAELDKLLG